MVSSALTDRSYRPSSGSSLEPLAAALYDAFAARPTPTEVEGCAHCVTEDDLVALAGPVATMSPAAVARFCLKAGTTLGGPDELRRLTPRLLTLAADRRLALSNDLLWRKLRWAGWTTWSPEEVEAIGRFLLGEFGRLLRTPPRPALVAHRWLREVSAGIDDLSGFFTLWHDSIGPLPEPAVQRAAVEHLVALLTTSALRPDLPATVDDVFAGNAAAGAQLVDFLCSPGTDHHLRRAASEQARTPGARRLGVAVERLRRFRAAVERGDAPAPDPDPLAP